MNYIFFDPETEMTIANPHTSSPAALAHTAIYETVLRLLKNEPRGRLLDVPSGEGALAQKLQIMGFSVVCSDLYPELFKVSGIEVHNGNLDATLPFPDQDFDIVVCVEGLEHIENPANAIREFARLIRPAGKLIVSVPNILNIEERLKWLFFGYTSHFKPVSAASLSEINQRFGGKAEIALHINPIGYSELRYLLETNGFRLTKTEMDKPKRGSFAFWPIVALIRLINFFVPNERRKERWADEINGPSVLTGGNTLIIEAIKT